jgi:hypothetical protein
MRGAAKLGDAANQRGAARVGRGASGCISGSIPRREPTTRVSMMAPQYRFILTKTVACS